MWLHSDEQPMIETRRNNQMCSNELNMEKTAPRLHTTTATTPLVVVLVGVGGGHGGGGGGFLHFRSRFSFG